MISLLPAAPSRGDSSEDFSAKADAFVAAMATLVSEMNAAISLLNANSWVSGTTYAIGNLVWSPANGAYYRRRTDGAGTIDPSADSTNWAAAFDTNLAGLLNLKVAAPIASAATLNLATAGGNIVHITGTVATSAVTMSPGEVVICIADAAWPLTYHATNNKISGNASYTLTAGDMVVYSYDGAVVRGQIIKADGTTISSKQFPSISAVQSSGAITTTFPGGNLDFQNSSLTNGATVSLVVSSNSGVIPSGATLGVPTGQSGRIAVIEFYNGGTPVIGWANIAGGVQLDESNLLSPTTISTGASSASTVYSASAVSANSPYRIIGFFDAINTAGVWGNPTLVRACGGQVLASLGCNVYGNSLTGSRAFGATYYNTTGKMKFVYVSSTAFAGANVWFSASVDGKTLIGSASGSSSSGAFIFFPVPPGAPYSVSNQNGTITVSNWMEFF